MNQTTRAYLIAALWTATGDDETPLDKRYNINNFTPDTIRRAESLCHTFTEGHSHLLESVYLDSDQIGHDLWLTRNGHGAGFWDRDLGDTGDLLTEICHTLGECHVLETGDGQMEIWEG